MNIHALCIGTNYLGTVNELGGCVNDARDLAKRFKPFCASFTVLRNGQATREGILKAARRTFKGMAAGDLLVLTFSGHGTRERDYSGDEVSGYDQALVCDDFELIYDDEMHDLLAERPPRTYVFAIIDACHSGTIYRSPIKPRTIPIGRCRTHKHDRRGQSIRTLTNAWAFLGCDEAGYSLDGWFNGRGNGVLTYYTLAALGQLPRKATYRDWFRLIAGKRPKGYLPNDDYDQQPVCAGSRASLNRPVPFL